ncbi:hypothetical protein AK812_SmicGene43291 [Symbiodinium microadriaticum]|uniref:Uncharacterized protein n=1 Tax=Symbiodinium microadriaticum TaxID=2951 RepID=A0A1Q9C1E6_SYMMI|nr:hypothetical protein AK812_SmicGene43291 [Symbiodinium microadriaticum]CAE7347611.1 unnamed protein product [Symbiodinium microadriaticum]
MSFVPASSVDEVLASSMETVESIVPPRSAEDSDQEEWEKINDDVAVARATLVHNMEAHDDAVANLTLSSLESVEADDTSLDERLREGFPHRGLPGELPGIGKKAADLAKQLTKQEIAALFSGPELRLKGCWRCRRCWQCPSASPGLGLAMAVWANSTQAAPLPHSCAPTASPTGCDLTTRWRANVMVEMQAGVHEVTEAREAAVLRHLDWTRTLEAQGPGHRMQEEGAAHAKVPKPVADTIDTWAPSSERPWMNPETFSGTWSLAALVPSRRGLNTKFLLNQSSPLQKLPTLASQHREVERVPAGTVEFQILGLKRLIELHMGSSACGEDDAGDEDPPAHLRSAFFEPIALTQEELDAQIAMGDRPRLENIVGPFHAKDDDEGYHWRKEVQTWDLMSLLSTFGHSYTARHLYAVWSHLPITLAAHKRGAKNATTNNQRRDDFRQIQKEAKEFVVLHDVPVPTSDFFAAKEHLRFRAVCDERITLPLKAFSDLPEIYNNLSAFRGQQAVVEVKMAWRCNTEQWWTARLRIILDPSAAEQERSLPMSGAHGMRFGAELRLPLEIVDKKKGETKGAQAQVRAAPAHPGEPPQHLYEAWVKDGLFHSIGAPSPFGRALIRAPDHLISVLLSTPLQSDGEILAGVLLEDIVDFMYRCRAFQELDRLLGDIVEKALSLTTGSKGDDDLQLLLSCVTLRRAEGDRLAWNRLKEGLLLSPCMVSRWRHWKPGKVSEHTVVNQRVLERGLSREKWGERLPIANQVPHMAAMMPPGTTVVSVELKGEFMDLLGDARFRTIRIRCLSYEELRRLGFTSIPWKESDVRTLLNTLRDREVSPHKLQQVWDTLKWFSKKFGLLAIDEIFRLTEKKKALSETLVSTVHRPMRKATVPSKAFVIQVEETWGSESRIHSMVTSTTVELAAWQTKTHSAAVVKKKPVPLICPKYSFSDKDWWTPLITTWRKLAATPMFEGMDYLIPTVGKDYDGSIARPVSSERALNWLRAALARQELQKDLWVDLTWHAFRVFMPDCAFQAQIPGTRASILGQLDG